MKDIFAKFLPKWTTQRDNYDAKGNPEFHNQCMTEAFTYFWRWLWKAFSISEIFFDARAYYAIIMNNLEQGETRYDWSVHIRVANEWMKEKNIKARLELHRTKEQWKYVLQSIVNGIPVVMGIDIRKELKSKTRKGHVVMLVGVSTDYAGEVRGIYLYDPYGNVNTNYDEKNGDTIFVGIEKAIALIGEDSHCAILETEQPLTGAANIG